MKWNAASDNVRVAGYNFYRDGLKINTALGVGTRYATDGPNGENVYEFTVKEVDAAGNESEFVDRNADSGTTIAFVQVYPNPNNG